MAGVEVAGRPVREGVWLIDVTGDMTVETASTESADLIAAAIAAPRSGLLLIDLRGLAGLSAAGGRLLRDLAGRTDGRGLTVSILATENTAVARVLAEAGVAGGAIRELPTYASPEEAIAAYEKAAGERPGVVAQAHGDDLSALSESFAKLTAAMLTAPSVDEVLRQVTEAALRLVPQADLVSVTLRGPKGELITPTETDRRALELDHVQYDAGSGPCVDTAHPDGPGMAVSEDLREESRWPRFAAAAVRHGFRAVMATELLPAAGPGHMSGALNIYAADPDSFTETDQATALILATHAALALAAARTRELAELNRHHMNRAVESRDVIGQAKGILMARRGLTADQAFDLLRRTSQDLNVKLVELAETLASRHSELDVAEPASD